MAEAELCRGEFFDIQAPGGVRGCLHYTTFGNDAVTYAIIMAQAVSIVNSLILSSRASIA